MRLLGALLALVVVATAQKVEETGYLFTAPKVLQAGTAERGCVHLYQMAGPGRALTLTFYERDAPRDQLDSLPKDSFELFKTEHQIPDTTEDNAVYCFDIDVPKRLTSDRVRMELVLTAGDQSFTKESDVQIKPETLMTLVQTDKAKYQPGQKVLFRVITLNYDLTAKQEDLKEVWVTNPQNVRLAQWKDVKTNTGMAQLEMQLTEETNLGHWTIHVKTTNKEVTKSFKVEEYVLPTFEVTVDAPKKIDNSEKTITANICAKYTFGKPLAGANVTIDATSTIGSYAYRNNKDLVKKLSDWQLADDEGCALFDMAVSKLGIGVRSIGGGNTVNLAIEVEEEGTGLKQKKSHATRQQYAYINLREPDNVQRYLKPKLPFYGSYSLKRQDDSPAVNEIIKVCYTAKYKDRAVTIDDTKSTSKPKDILYRASKKYAEKIQTEYGYSPIVWEIEDPKTRTTNQDCREYSTDATGSITYFIPPQAEDIDSVDLSISTRVGGNSDNRHSTLEAFFSPSGSYMAIDAHELPELLPCSGEVVVKLGLSREAEPDYVQPEITYAILSRGRLINVGKAAADNTVTVGLLPKMAPEFKLLVYYIQANGEVVSDSRVFKVDKCFPNQVQVSWDKEQVKPGDSASFTIRAAPNSICGVSAVDKSTELLGTENQITLDTVFSKLNQFVISRYDSPNQVKSTQDYCVAVQRELEKTLQTGGASTEEVLEPPPLPQTNSDGSFFIPRPRTPTFRTDRIDSIKAFDEAGFLVITNLGVETRQCYKRVPAEEVVAPEPVSAHKTSGPQEFVAFARPVSQAAPQQAFLGASPPAADTFAAAGAAGGGGSAPQEDQVRDFFPEAFLFSVETLDADGVNTIVRDMPDTITSWVGSAICTNSKDGFGLSNKINIVTFKPFFLEVTLPYGLKRGEILKMPAKVFNYLDSDLSVSLELAESEQYSLASADAYPSFDLCIPAGASAVKEFPLTFSALGDVNITVTASAKEGNCGAGHTNAVKPGSDTIIKKVVLKPEGFPQEETKSRFVCLDKGDENHVETIAMPEREGLVADSQRAYFSVIGDILGPTYQNLESGLIAAPTGGGEPNMVTFVPNIFAGKYLKEVNLLTDQQERRLRNNIRSGYQRQLRYRRYDGSYSSYGQEDPEGSVWLTAFVVKSFTEAKDAGFLEVDAASVNQSVQWLLRQQKPGGCFPRKGDLIHKELKGGTERGGEAALTAFVMLSIQPVATSEQLAGGFACLEDAQQYPDLTLYSQVLMAHTYLKLGQELKGQRLVEKLMEKAQREGYDVLYWEGDRSSLIGGSRAVDIEMTSYMVLSLLHISGKGYLEDAARAVRWITTQRNSKGGFVATQDTIKAVEALTEFANRTFTSELSTSVAVTAGGEPVTFTLDADNRLLLQQQKVPDLTLPASVTFDVSPPGCVVIQSVFKYSSKLRVPNPAFSLAVATKQRGRSGYEVEVCVSYLRGSTGVDKVIVELELPSGYIPVAKTLHDLKRTRAVRDYKDNDKELVFTLPKVAEEKSCLEFRILEANEVDERKPSVAKVYDFYRTEDRNRLEYELTATAA